eukprot:4804342-Amphidinium_carterae.1
MTAHALLADCRQHQQWQCARPPSGLVPTPCQTADGWLFHTCTTLQTHQTIATSLDTDANQSCDSRIPQSAFAAPDHAIATLASAACAHGQKSAPYTYKAW